jgi:hypothetical protein
MAPGASYDKHPFPEEVERVSHGCCKIFARQVAAEHRPPKPQAQIGPVKHHRRGQNRDRNTNPHRAEPCSKGRKRIECRPKFLENLSHQLVQGSHEGPVDACREIVHHEAGHGGGDRFGQATATTPSAVHDRIPLLRDRRHPLNRRA